MPAWILFAIVFYWTPPHFWALALRYKDDYAGVEVPMLPVVAGPKKTAQQIIIYSAMLVFVTLWLVPVSDLGWIYGVSAVVLGAWMLFDSVRLLYRPDTAMNLFRTSTIYLSLLFAAIWVDVVV